MRTKLLKVFFFVTLLLLNLQALPKGVMSAAPTSICLKGRLLDGVGNYFIHEGYVFALSTDKDEILGYSRTKPASGPNAGSWKIEEIPIRDEILLVGFHATSKFNLVLKELPLNKIQEVQDIGILITKMSSHQSAPGGPTGSAWDILSLAGWIAGEVNSKNANEQAAKLAEDLLNRIEDKTAYKKAANEFMMNYKFPEDIKDSYFDYSFISKPTIEEVEVVKADLDQDGMSEYFCKSEGRVKAPNCCNQVFFFTIWEKGNLKKPVWVKVSKTSEGNYMSNPEIGNLGEKPIIVIKDSYYSFKMGKTIYDKSCLIYYAIGEYKFVVKE